MAAKVNRITTGASTNLTKIQSWGANITSLYVANTSASVFYVKIYVSPTTAPTVGTTTPAATLGPFAATSGTQLNWSVPTGYVAGDVYVATTGLPADNDTTAVSAGSFVNVWYE
jgi:hypothetical protein